MMAVGRVKCAAYYLCILIFIYLTLLSQKPWFYSVKYRCCESQHFYVGSIISRQELCSSIKNRSSHSRYSAITSVDIWTKADATIRLTRDFLLVNILILCSGDISTNPGPAGLRLCHWNVQRLTDSKLEELRIFVTNTHKELDILVITETFCTSRIPDSFYSIPDFQLHRKDRLGKSGGRILAWVRSSLHVKRRDDLETNDLETLWLEVCPYKSKRPLFVAGVYRPPSYRIDDDKKLAKNIETLL